MTNEVNKQTNKETEEIINNMFREEKKENLKRKSYVFKGDINLTIYVQGKSIEDVSKIIEDRLKDITESSNEDLISEWRQNPNGLEEPLLEFGEVETYDLELDIKESA